VEKSEMSNSIALELRDVIVRRGVANILGPISWQASADQRWVILGPNGAGKTTLLSLLSTRSHPTAGSVNILGETLGKVDVFELRPRIGLLSPALGLENANELWEEKVSDVVLTASYGILGRWREEYEIWDESRAQALLTILGIPELKDRHFFTLSDGEKKRTLLARALMSNPEILLLDEPAAGLDLRGREELLTRMETLFADPMAPLPIFVTHHLEEIPRGITHALLLAKGKIVAAGEIDQVITSEYLSESYGYQLQVRKEDGRFWARGAN
jgi:iron complex transport system ATP-binding protein